MTLLAGTVHHVMLCGPVILVKVPFISMQIGQSQQCYSTITPVNTSVAIHASLIRQPGCIPLNSASDNRMWEAEMMHVGLLCPSFAKQHCGQMS